MAVTFIQDNQGDKLNINKDGSLNITLSISRIKDYWTDQDNQTRKFQTPQDIVSIMNDADTPLTFTVGTFTITVPPHESFEDAFPAFTILNVNANGPYRGMVKGT
ncbi:hypothetical protein [Priestia megaterium]|uniref:hypothetical protein n=1 Tax=Priestia megaterium TaxID=1404 RepID=UPI000BFC18FB|nr:hypothetical protein [Priestia megaterium]PGQ88328.1 hypothetical protein COA18_05205 [Priestia megaterium]